MASDDELFYYAIIIVLALIFGLAPPIYNIICKIIGRNT